MRLLIVSNNLHIGGVQKALVDMLWNISDKQDVTLLLFSGKGAYLEDIPQSVKLETVTSAYKYLGIISKDNCSKKEKLLRSFFALITRVFGRKYAVSLMALTQKKTASYDVAISFMHNPSEKLFLGGCNDFVLRHVPAKKKITFLHCDYSKINAHTKENTAQYRAFDTIAACSAGCKNSFLEKNPDFADKTKVVTNFHRFDKIKQAAQKEIVKMSAEKINLLTVARLGNEKGVIRALHALQQLSHRNFHYYIVGDGIQRREIEAFIKENGLCEFVTLCGEKPNPYPYMKAADLLVIPSVSEAAPIVIDEAASLGLPILSTRTSSADEMITERNIGWVCENSLEGIKNALDKLLSEPLSISDKKAFISDMIFDNSLAKTQLENILNI